MAKSITARLPDGSLHTYDNVPDNVTQEQADARAAQQFGARPAAAKISPESQSAAAMTHQQSATQAPAVEQDSFSREGILRGMGLGARDLITGAAGLPSLAVDVATTPLTALHNAATTGYNKLTGRNAPQLPYIGGTQQLLQSGLDKTGLPRAASDDEKMLSAVTQGVAGTATGLGGGQALSGAASPMLQRLASILSTAPRTQLAVGAASPAAGEAVRQGGGGEGTQLAAELATGIGVGSPGTLTRPVARGAANILGFTTGAGGKAIKEAANAGFTGGKTAEAFRANISDRANSLDVVNEAKSALNEIRADRAKAYNSGMVDIKSDATVLDMKPILAKVDEVRNRGIFKGKVKNESASKTWEEIDAAVKDWNTSNPADFHTPEGLDALKQRIGDIRDSQQIGTPSYNAAKEVYNAVKEQIAAQAPTYSKVMRDYTDASELISQMEGALSLGNKAQADTALRKLQSLLRNNVQTNYGRRDELGQILAGKGATTLYPALAGQALNSMMPRSMSGINSATGVGLAGILSAKALPMLAMTSPRLMGEAAYGAGKIAGLPNRMATALMRGGKLPQTTGMNRDQLAAALAAMNAANAGQQ